MLEDPTEKQECEFCGNENCDECYSTVFFADEEDDNETNSGEGPDIEMEE